ncbi:ABC transporter ATP-binding protein [Desulfosporosinus sp. BICA1-9]|uniref:ABC transporter ATP-binding protein n=1 Tax=Desulfosporosinus sp. BICA1-9 TaxID=1531958 RepID=UPI00054C23CF|nr:dipeptide ABC transporter ATP-binding protein [Desulfosporosinus sp. BICA1-9]KJS49325.1 MAG: peptide ABC transporter ATP-binding protein [Peptococcaceae bacterium BRH_c23]KJS83674.1 MAG: peptide ABC transporter ATP-binding protein [Desulfosporosinus sp. BICA1-9]HBW35523.1 dipeptide ABC transporter ATP-binding protein [Desulfosporosinus sp.]
MEVREDYILEVNNLVKHFPLGGGLLSKKQQVVQAVNGISFKVKRGETLGIVGESGCGKSTAGRSIIRLYEPTAGQIIFEGKDVTKAQGNDLMELRRNMQMIFQDPYASLNPRMTVGDIVAEALDIHRLATGQKRTDRIYELLKIVGLNPEHANRFPHEFSGGQRQRIGIARALAVNPSLIICDEPISALDVSIQAQIVNMLEELQAKLGLTYLFIAHDLSMVKYISHRIAVMYLGRIVELTSSNDLYANPMHPYTQGLLSAIPIPDPHVEAKRQRIVPKGNVPSPIDPPSGCYFRTRCPHAMEVCAKEAPELKDMGNEHFVACHLV